jgi:hypothetical protein
VYRPGDYETVQTITAAFRQHYNEERPHQGQACGNRPPRVAFADLPARPAVPALVDPDRWIEVLPGQRYVRKVQRNTSVTLDTVRYYTSQALVGKYVTLRIDASDRTFVVEHEGHEIKRLPIQETGQAPLPFVAFVEQLCAQIYYFCKERWQYQVPTAKNDQHYLYMTTETGAQPLLSRVSRLVKGPA